jgi:hypothetical protein
MPGRAPAIRSGFFGACVEDGAVEDLAMEFNIFQLGLGVPGAGEEVL